MTTRRRNELIRFHGQAGRPELADRYDRACARAAKTGKRRDLEEARFLGELLETGGR